MTPSKSTRSHASRSVGTLALFALLAMVGCAPDQAPITDGAVRHDTGRTDGAGGNDVPSTGFDVIPIATDASDDVNWYAMRHDGMVDPPPMYCLPDGGHVTGDAGADPYCPADRNLQGCNCPTVGMTAPCFTGPRSSRNRGNCHDGMTTCSGEEIPTWGPCVGEVDPDPTATRGPATCNCFSMGTWTIPNTSPCFVYTDATYTTVEGATSSILTGTTVDCGTQTGLPLMRPGPTWSTDTLQVDCGGTFHICYRLRAFGSMSAAMSMTVADSDCVMAEPCVDAVVPPSTTPMTITLPPLPGWATTTPTATACAQTFVTNGGYAEMVVSGTSYECQDFAQGMSTGFVFNRIDYCPSACNNPTIPASMRPAICTMCGNGGSGMF